MSSGKNIGSIEMMRGIAAFMVAYFHMAVGSERYLPDTNIFDRIGTYGWAGVEIFFVISGFIITYAMHYGGYRPARAHRFLAKRFTRLEPPYIVSILLVMLLMYVSTLSPYYRGKPLHYDWGNILGHLGYVNAFTGATWLQDVYWSLAIEFEFYLSMALLFPLLVHRSKMVSYPAMAALLVMTYIPAGKAHVFQWLPFFAMGIYLCRLQLKQITLPEFTLFMTAATVICYLWYGGVLTGMGLATVAMIAFVKNVPKPLAWLGHISYSLYLLHIPIGGRIINISEVLIKNEYLRSAMVFVALAVSIACAKLFYNWIEKPCQRWSKNIKY